MVQKRGRKSAEDLAVIDNGSTLVIPRPDAPLDLTAEESDVWNATVDAMPADCFRAETFPLLKQWARHTVTAGRVAQLIDNAMSRDEVDQAEIKELLGMQAKETAALKALAEQQAKLGDAHVQRVSRRQGEVVGAVERLQLQRLVRRLERPPGLRVSRRRSRSGNLPGPHDHRRDGLRLAASAGVPADSSTSTAAAGSSRVSASPRAANSWA